MGNALAARTADRPLLPRQAFRVLADEKLAGLAARGDDDAFAALYQRYHQPIYRYCHSLLRQDADARDALQSSMVAALASLRKRPIEGAFKPWLYRIAHNESISIIRGRAREAPTETPAPAAVSDDPETREQLRTLVSDLTALPERQRGAIVMRELSGLSYTEIATALGTSQAAGKQLVYEARLALQDLRAGHEMSCDVVRERISAQDRRLLRGRRIRSHLRGCEPCQDFEQAIRPRRKAFALLAPPLSPLVATAVLQDVFGGGAGSGGAGGAGAAGVTGIASGSVPAVAGPVALKAAAVLLAGAAGVGAYAAGTSILGDEATPAPAAATERDPSAGKAAHRDTRGTGGDSARAPSADKRAADARGAADDKGLANPGAAAARDGGESRQAGDPIAPGTRDASGSAGAGGAGSANTGGSDSDSAGAGGSDSTGSASEITEQAPAGEGPSGDSGGGDSGGGTGGPPSSPPPTSPPPDPAPPPEPAPPPGGGVPPGTPPGHGGTPPGHGGIPPGQAPGGTPPGHINNPGHGP